MRRDVGRALPEAVVLMTLHWGVLGVLEGQAIHVELLSHGIAVVALS